MANWQDDGGYRQFQEDDRQGIVPVHVPRDQHDQGQVQVPRPANLPAPLPDFWPDSPRDHSRPPPWFTWRDDKGIDRLDRAATGIFRGKFNAAG